MADGRYWLSYDAQDIDDTIDEVVAARGSDASLSARLADIVGDFEADQQRQETEIGVVAAMGAKNFLKVTGQTQTINGVTFTVNSDQTVSLSGTASATTTFVVSDNASATRIPNGNYVLTGCPSGGGSTTYDLRWYLYSSGKSAYDQGSGASVNKTGNTTSSNIAILIRSGVNTDGLVFRPMLRPAEITDSTYAPYAPTNRELYEVKADKGSFDLTIAGTPLVASEYSYSCIITGDIVTICIRLVLGDELAVNTSRNLFKIPADYRPPVTCAGTGYADSKLRTFWVNTSGDIKIRIDEAIPAGASINANFCYSYKAANWTTVTPASLQSAPASLMQAGRLDAELTDVQEVTENDT